MARRFRVAAHDRGVIFVVGIPLCLMVARCSPSEVVERRLIEKYRPATLTEATVGGVLRKSIRVSRTYGMPILDEVRDIGPGEVNVWLAPARLTTHGKSTARVMVIAKDWQARAGRPLTASCSVEWTASTESVGWRECVIELPRAIDRATVAIDFDAGVGSLLYVSDLLLTSP